MSFPHNPALTPSTKEDTVMFQNKKFNQLTLSAVIMAAALMAPQGRASEATLKDGKLAIDTLPFALDSQLDLGAASVTDKALVLQAKKGTDLYANPDGTEIADKTPRVLFQPTGDFIFSAKVTAGVNHPFNGGALIVYNDKTNWAKLLFEFSKTGAAGISTTVTKGAGDDAHHGVRPGDATYLKVVRRKDMFVFYTSPDGAAWSMVRNFSLPGAATAKVGFSSQSPAGDGFSAQFSDVKFRNATFKDFWQGE
jgi:regulation of enolase protein 1 (concanavalin A-like superfamily)